jgi:CRISPR-associated protein Cst2
MIMAFATGLFLIDAPASALNNLGNIPGSREDNSVGVKLIRAKDGAYPYVSAQSFRYWLRTTLENDDLGWRAAPMFREEKIAYTDANPIKWWDDDLFGYMRAPSKKASAKEKREADTSRVNETPTTDTITRASPFRVSTLVSIAPVSPTEDFGTMSRHEGNPVPHEHQFYRTTLKGLFSLDLHACGTFSYRQKTGFRNLDDERIGQAQAEKLEHLEAEKSYRLSAAERTKRVSALFEGFARLAGGAKQSLHYTDVAPAFAITAITKGGNHPFARVIGANGRGLPEVKIDALNEALTVFGADLLSPLYVGWAKGFMDDERARFEAALANETVLAPFASRIRIMHPKQAFETVADSLLQEANLHYLD